MKCEEDDQDPNNEDDIQYSTETNSTRSKKVIEKRVIARKRLIKRIPNETVINSQR